MATEMRYFQIDTMPLEDEDHVFLATPPTAIEMIEYKMCTGEPIQPEYPPDVRYYMDEEHPGVKLGDVIANSRSLLMVSRRMKEVIEQVNRGPTEYLPVSIYNHKRRRASADYWVMNPLGTVDCLDLDRSEIERQGNAVVEIEKIVLDPGKLTGVPDLFRLKEDPYIYVMSENLGQELLPLDPTNLFLIELEIAP